MNRRSMLKKNMLKKLLEISKNVCICYIFIRLCHMMILEKEEECYLFIKKKKTILVFMQGQGCIENLIYLNLIVSSSL